MVEDPIDMSNETKSLGKSLFVNALSSASSSSSPSLSDGQFLETFMSFNEIVSYRRLFEKIQRNNRVPSSILKGLLTRADLTPETLRRTILRTRSLLPRYDSQGFVSFCCLFKTISYVQNGGDILAVDSLTSLRDARPCLAQIRGVTTKVTNSDSTNEIDDEKRQIVQLRSSSKLKAMFGVAEEVKKTENSPEIQLRSSSKLKAMFGIEGKENENASEKIKKRTRPRAIRLCLDTPTARRISRNIKSNFDSEDSSNYKTLLRKREEEDEAQVKSCMPGFDSSSDSKKRISVARTVSSSIKNHFATDDTSMYRRMLRNVDDQDFAATEWISFKGCIPDSSIRNDYKSRVRQEFISDSFVENLMSKVVGVHKKFDKISFEQYSRKKKAIFVFGPSAAGKSFGLKSNLKTLLKIANWSTELLFHTIDGGQMRDASSLWAEMKLTRLSVIRQKLFGDMKNEDDERFESKTDFRGFTDLYSRYFKKYIHKVKDRMFDMLLARGSNIIIPDTATSLLKDRTFSCSSARVYHLMHQLSQSLN